MKSLIILILTLLFTLPAFADQLHTCTRAIDGDTIQLEDGSRVRYIGNRILSENEAEEVKKIWRVIGNQEIVKWDGEEWLAKTEAQKKEVIKSACEVWRKAGYQRIESIEYFIEDIDKYYRHFEQKNPEEGMKAKVGLVLSLSAFFSGIEIMVN